MTDLNQTHLACTQRQYAAIVDLVTNQSALKGGFPAAAWLITETAAEVLDVGRVGVWLLSDDHATVRCVDLFERKSAKHSKDAVLDARNYPRYFDALSAGRAVDAHDARTDPRTDEFTDGYLVPHGITSMLDAPIRVSGEVVGAVCHEHVGPARQWTDDEISFAAQIADQAAQALISEQRKKAEQALRESEERYRSLVELAPDSIATLDLMGRITSTNLATCDIGGYEEEEVIGKPFWKLGLFRARDIPKYVKLFYSLVRGAASEPIELICLSKDGTLVTLESRVGYLKRNGRLVGLQIISRDITERKRAEEAIRREVTFRNQIVGRAAEGMCVCHNTPEYPYVAFTVWNSRMMEITGYTMDQINRLGWYQTVYPDPETREKAIRRMESMREGDDLIREEWEITRADGEKRALQISTSVVAEEGETKHVFAVMLDVTDRKKAEQQLRQRDAEMAHMSRLHTVGEMAGELAHELNQPLYAINNYVRGIQRRLRKKDPTSEFDELSDAIEHVSTEVMRAAGIISHLREFVRGRELRRSSVDTDRLLRQAIDFLQPLARGKGVTLQLEVGDDLPHIEADPVQVEQVVVNLVANAIDAVSDLPAERRSVVLGARLSVPGAVEIAVRDRGRGIAKELGGKLFEAFTTTKENGLGVGLAISRSIVHSHGGRIWFAHNEPHGAAFHFTLPRLQHEEARDR